MTLSCTIAKRDLSRLATQMAGVAERKSTMPILACVLLTAKDGRLTLSATDLYMGLTGHIEAEVATPGTLAVSAKDLVDRVKQMPDGPISIAVKDNALTLKAKGAARRYTLRGMPGDDFPPMQSVTTDAASVAISAGILGTLIARTHYAVSTDETRAHLNSALFEWEGERIRMVATDGHRLALADVSLPGRHGSTTALIPLKALHEVNRLCDEDREAEIRMAQIGATIFFTTRGMTFSVKTVEATFPPYKQVIPKESTRVATVPRALLADAVKAVSVAASDKTGGVRLTLTKNLLKLVSESPESGDGSDEVVVDYDGPPIMIGLAARYLVDALGAVPDEEVTLSCGEELDPIVIRAGSEFLAVVMPMRI